jgi:hypothetical protein
VAAGGHEDRHHPAASSDRGTPGTAPSQFDFGPTPTPNQDVANPAVVASDGGAAFPCNPAGFALQLAPQIASSAVVRDPLLRTSSQLRQPQVVWRRLDRVRETDSY